MKRALENPANPNEPKGLGTAATRDTMLPKLIKSHYAALGKGRDPAIEVTEVGLAFLAAVRRVFPAYGDPVGRAVFEAELGEIGRAPTRAEAIRRADAFRQRTRSRVGELIGAVAGSAAIDVAPGARQAAADGPSRPPTAPMLAYAASLAERKGLKLPRGLEGDGRICRAFLAQHGAPRPEGPAGARPPSPAMLRYAQSLARQLGVVCPAEAAEDFGSCRRFLDAHAGGGSPKDLPKPAKDLPKPAKGVRRPSRRGAPSGDARG